MIFGTDGIRGIVDKEINCNLAYSIGKAMAQFISQRNLPRKVIIGKDTRLSGDAYACSLASGLSDFGIDSILIGIAPTPVVSFLVSKLNVGAGVMITASHNDSRYNGIKCFSESGDKMSKSDELEIEKYMQSESAPILTKGKIIHDAKLVDIYKSYIKKEFRCDLSALDIVIDSANGANYELAPQIYRDLGANVIKVACENKGNMINENCGANHIDKLTEQVIEHGSHFGIAFDGDGDRLRIVLGNGRVLNGDHILFVFSKYLKSINKLGSMSVVGTIMSNQGLEQALQGQGIDFYRTDVGDKNVINLMKEKRLTIGGEPSGHICMYEHNGTCDALLNSLQFFKIILENHLDIEKYLLEIQLVPSIIKNIEVDSAFRQKFDENIELAQEIEKIQTAHSDVRIVVRPSGTEPVIRLFVEGLSEINNNIVVEKLINLLSQLQS